jgi:macrolide-specific efflux system membrane fusion protein
MSKENQSDSGNKAVLPGQRSKKRKSRVFGILVLLAMIGGGGWWYFYGMQEEQVEDQPLLATVEIGNIENTIASAGSLKPSDYVDVGAQVSGQLQKLHVDVGDVVEAGQLLAEIDARVQEARVEASRANLQALEAQLDARRSALELARANAARQERLMSEDATSQLEFDTAMNNLASAQASLVQLEKQIDQSRASLTSDETTLEFSKIYAPSPGTIVSVEMNEGRTLNAAQQAPTILRIADLGLMTVEADISEADIGNIRRGMDVYFTTLGGGTRRWYGTLRQILPTPTVTNNVVLYTGLFDIENEDGALLSEMTAQVYFITSQAQNVLTVPLGAVRFPDAAEMAARFAARAGAGGGGAQSAEANGSFTPPAGGAGPRGQFAGRGQGGQFAAGGQGGQGPIGGAGRPRPATVTVVKDDGTREERQIMVGVTSRVAAEVISGLQAGEKVIAGIIQNNAAAGAGQNQQNGFRPGGFPGGGGFRRF